MSDQLRFRFDADNARKRIQTHPAGYASGHRELTGGCWLGEIYAYSRRRKPLAL
jgi:hypothetical protein